MEQIIGHSRVIGWLNDVASRNAWSHAYLFVGPEGVGKRLVAQLAFSLMNKKDFRDNDPDFLYVKPENSSLSIEQIRKIKDFLSLKPYASTRQCVVIDNADSMTDEAANAFLKTLEEPNSATIFLLAKSKISVPVTISSRCQSIYFSTLNPGEMDIFVKSIKIKESEREFLIKAAHGRPGWIVDVLNRKLSAKLIKYNQALEKSFDSNLADKIATAREIYESEEYEKILESFMFAHFSETTSLNLSKIMRAYALILDSRYNHRLIIENMLLG